MPRRNTGGSDFMMSLPSIRIRPPVGSIMRLIIRSDVVLPQPDGPTNTVIRPASIVRSSLLTAIVPSGYCLVTAWNSITRDPPGRDGHSPAAAGSHDPSLRHRRLLGRSII